ncbi:hypothetical protein CEXT_551391 [Caerostris extrusa]|uniref:Uncharacterized protein n=1 Tax=Caerostris extrusa TaxID=172846 RepID=A0AAV4UQ85_CAEEX|nr:hypothetical protein CEXT_551391 [Caerostris extrusa]
MHKEVNKADGSDLYHFGERLLKKGGGGFTCVRSHTISIRATEAGADPSLLFSGGVQPFELFAPLPSLQDHLTHPAFTPGCLQGNSYKHFGRLVNGRTSFPEGRFKTLRLCRGGSYCLSLSLENCRWIWGHTAIFVHSCNALSILV